MINSRLVHHIKEVAHCPSFSSYEERLHPYIRTQFNAVPAAEELPVKGNSLIFRIGDNSDQPTIAVSCHLDKINHYGKEYPDVLPVSVSDTQIKGAMDNSAGVGLALALAEEAKNSSWPNLLFFFSEMEESKGLNERPELLKNSGKGYTNGMGARRIAAACKTNGFVPDEVITLDTTPLFKGNPGVALYSKHWELNELDAPQLLKEKTKRVEEHFKIICPEIALHNNTNDYLHYGYEFNIGGTKNIVSVALEPSIYPYHQRGEKVFLADLQKVFEIMKAYLNDRQS